MQRTIAQVSDGFTVGGAAQFTAPCTVARGLSACLTNSVAGHCTFQNLVANILFGRPKDSVFFHTGD
jgi:hypothetical protein